MRLVSAIGAAFKPRASAVQATGTWVQANWLAGVEASLSIAVARAGEHNRGVCGPLADAPRCSPSSRVDEMGSSRRAAQRRGVLVRTSAAVLRCAGRYGSALTS